MGEWPHEDRRKSPEPALMVALEKVISEFRDFRVESRKYRSETQRDIVCLREGFETFRDKYQKHLDEQLSTEAYWAIVRKDLLSSVVKSLVTAALVAVGVIIALGGQTWFRAWLGIQ